MNEKNGSILFSQVKWTNDDSVVAFVDTICRQKETYNLSFERQAELNIEWYKGNQNLLWDARSGKLGALPNPYQRVRMVCNLILPLVNTYLSKLSQNVIHLDALPATPDLDDINTAELQQNVLRYYEDYLPLRRRQDESDQWCALAGESYTKVCWDPNRGPETDYAAEIGADHDEFRKQFREEPVNPIGDLDVHAINPQNLVWGPWGCEFDDAEWVLTVTERSKSYLCARYDLDPDELSSDAGDSEMGYSRTSRVAKSFGLGGDYSNRRVDSELMLVKELWVARNTKFHPMGRHVVVAGGKVLNRKRNKQLRNPYNHGEIPIIGLKHLQVPGEPRGLAIVTNMLAPQAEFNRNISQQVENRELMANPFILAQKGSLSNANEWDNRVGGIRFFSGMVPPQVVPGSAMPSMVLQELQRMEKVMQDIIAIHDVSQAKVPSGVKSGVAIRQLQEADDMRMGTISDRRTIAWQRVGQLMLKTLAQYVEEERLIRIAGTENSWQVKRFVGNQLVGSSQGAGVQYFDVRVRTNGMPISKAARQELVTSLAQYGILNPQNPDDRKLLLDAVELGQATAKIDPDSRHRSRAQAENYAMTNGQKVSPHESDKDTIHVEEHTKYQTTTEFRSLPDEIQALHEAHMKEHKKIMAFKALEPTLILEQVKREMGMGAPPVQAAPPQPAMNGNGNGHAGNGRLNGLH